MAAKKKPAPKKPTAKKTTAPAKKAAPKKAPAKAKTTKTKPASKSAKKPAPAKKKAAAPAKKTSGTAAKKTAAKRAPLKSKRPAPARKAPAKKAAAPKKPPVPPNPEALVLARRIAEVAADKKAEDIVIIGTGGRSSAVGYDYVVIATGESDRQLSAIQEGVDDVLRPEGKKASIVEASPDWVLVNYDEGVVAHFFTADKRGMMDLEELWKDGLRITT